MRLNARGEQGEEEGNPVVGRVAFAFDLLTAASGKKSL